MQAQNDIKVIKSHASGHMLIASDGQEEAYYSIYISE